MQKNLNTKALSRTAMIAALYVVISLALLPLTFGAVQVRISEALTLLPVLTPLGTWGVTIGCLLTNTYGVAAGANILGAADILFGTAATLAAALLTRRLRRYRFAGIPLLAALPPVLINALVIGAELTYAECNRLTTPLFWLNVAQVGLGQFFSCVVMGTILVLALEKKHLAPLLFGEDLE